MEISVEFYFQSWNEAERRNPLPRIRSQVEQPAAPEVTPRPEVKRGEDLDEPNGEGGA